MNPVVEEGARAAAAQLTEQYGPDVVMQVETELHRDPRAAPEQYIDPISIATLIVSVAGLAWTVYQDLRKPNQPEPDPQVVARTVRVQLQVSSDLPQQERARLIDVTVGEVLRHTQTMQ